MKISVGTGYFNDINEVNNKVIALFEHFKICFHRNRKLLSLKIPKILHDSVTMHNIAPTVMRLYMEAEH